MITITPHSPGIGTGPLTSVAPRPPAAQMQPLPQDQQKPQPVTPSPGRLLDITT